MLRLWRTKVANFRYCPPVSRRRALIVCFVSLLELSLKIVLYWFIHVSTIDYDQERSSALTKILGICFGFKCEVMAEFSVCRLWPV